MRKEIINDGYLGKMEKEIYIREYIYEDQLKPAKKFINTGIWADGHLAYSILDKDNNIIEEDNGMFVQIRYHGRLVMIRI